MTRNFPWYISRFELVTPSPAVDYYIARGMVTTGPNAGQFVSHKADSRDDAVNGFLRMAGAAHRGKEVGQ